MDCYPLLVKYSTVILKKKTNILDISDSNKSSPQYVDMELDKDPFS